MITDSPSHSVNDGVQCIIRSQTPHRPRRMDNHHPYLFCAKIGNFGLKLTELCHCVVKQVYFVIIKHFLQSKSYKLLQ